MTTIVAISIISQTQKLTARPCRYSLAITGDIFDVRTGHLVMTVSSEEAERYKRMGGPRMERWVERSLRDETVEYEGM